MWEWDEQYLTIKLKSVAEIKKLKKHHVDPPHGSFSPWCEQCVFSSSTTWLVVVVVAQIHQLDFVILLFMIFSMLHVEKNHLKKRDHTLKTVHNKPLCSFGLLAWEIGKVSPFTNYSLISIFFLKKHIKYTIINKKITW